MLAALGGVSSAYHLTKMLEWRSYEQLRVEEAERLLRQYQVQGTGRGFGWARRGLEERQG